MLRFVAVPEHHISKYYLNTAVQKIHIFRLELQRWPFEFIISFSTVCTMVFGIEVWLIAFWDHVIKISIKQMNFQHIFS